MRENRFKGNAEKGIIHIEDLVPIDDVRGGSGRILFGERGDLSHTHAFPHIQSGIGSVSCRCPGFISPFAACWRWCLKRVSLRRVGCGSEKT